MKCDPFAWLKIVSAFLLFSLIGWVLVRPEEPKSADPPKTETEGIPPPREITLKLYVCDTEGNFIEGSVYGEGIPGRQNIRSFESTRAPLQELRVTIKPEKTRLYGGEHPNIKLVWKSATNFRKWLKNDLRNLPEAKHMKPETLERLIQRLDGYVTEAKHSFPVILPLKSKRGE